MSQDIHFDVSVDDSVLVRKADPLQYLEKNVDPPRIGLWSKP